MKKLFLITVLLTTSLVTKGMEQENPQETKLVLKDRLELLDGGHLSLDYDKDSMQLLVRAFNPQNQHLATCHMQVNQEDLLTPRLHDIELAGLTYYKGITISMILGAINRKRDSIMVFAFGNKSTANQISFRHLPDDHDDHFVNAELAIANKKIFINALIEFKNINGEISQQQGKIETGIFMP